MWTNDMRPYANALALTRAQVRSIEINDDERTSNGNIRLENETDARIRMLHKLNIPHQIKYTPSHMLNESLTI